MKRCTKCMEELKPGDQFCPHCGYEPDSDIQPPNALKRDTLLRDRYYIGNVIGQGGFGITYVGWDLTLEMKVAIKEYFPSGSATRTNSLSNQIQWDFTGNGKANWSEGMERFLKEARKMAKLDSVPAIVRVRDAFAENQTAYIVMDFVEGDTLKTYLLGHGVLRYEECMTLLSPILDSLAVIHDRGFIHRDISPDNIMLQPDGTARLLDMGAAVDVEANDGHASMAVVKKNFSAPEQYMESESLGSWTDVYAMAATIYYSITGKAVPEALEREFKKTPLYFDPAFNIPAHVIGALRDGLALHAENRIRDMRELKRRLTAPVEDTVPTMPFQAGPIPTPVVEETQSTGQPERKVESGQDLKEKQPPRPGRLKRTLKIVLITIGALFAMSVLTVFYYAFQGIGDAASASVQTSAATQAETTEEAVAAQTTEAADTANHMGEQMESAVQTTAAEERADLSRFYKVEPSELTYKPTEDGSGMILISYMVEEEKPYIKLPDEIDGLPVVELGEFLFKENKTLEEVILPEHLETIGTQAFGFCSGIKQIQLPEGLKKIGEFAFWETSIQELTIPSSVDDLDRTNLRKMQVKIAEGNSKYEVVDGVLYTDGNKLVAFPEDREGTFIIPSNIEIIGEQAFRDTSLKSITIPGTVRVVEEHAFFGGHSLEEVVIEEGVEELNQYAFRDCTALRKITIPGSVKELGAGAFLECTGLEDVLIEDGTGKLGDNCFQGCTSLSHILIPSSVKVIGEFAFYDCGSLEVVGVSGDCQIDPTAFSAEVQIVRLS